MEKRDDESDADLTARLLVALDARDAKILEQEARINALEAEISANADPAASRVAAVKLLGLLDAGGDGSVPDADILSVLTILDPNLAVEHIRAALLSMASYKDGRVRLEEFISWLYGSDAATDEESLPVSPKDTNVCPAAAVDASSRKALAGAASAGEVSKLRLLLDARAVVDACDCNGSALLGAARAGRDACVELLLEARACVNAANAKGSTPLISAARRDHSASVSLLLEAMADANLADTAGATAIFYAAQGGYATSLAMLLGKRADPNATNHEGTPALGCAAYFDHGDCVKLLAAARADLGAVDSEGQTALVIAARKGLSDTVASLVEARTDLHSTAHRSGDVAMSWAVLLGHVDCVTHLLAGGANPNVEETSSGRAVLSFAAEQSSQSSLRMAIELIKAGADLEALPPSASMCEELREFVKTHDRPQPLALTIHVGDAETDGCVSICCTNMAGEEMAAVCAELEKPFSEVRMEIRRQLDNGPCKCMLPCGHVIAPNEDTRLVADVLSLRGHDCAA